MASVLDQLQAEFKHLLDFSCERSQIKNDSRPDAETIRVKDVITFPVYATNKSSSITLKNISGVVRPSAATKFDEKQFAIDILAPNQTKLACTVEKAEVVKDVNTTRYFGGRDLYAIIAAYAEVDLSSFAFSDSGFLMTVILPE